MRPRRPVRRRDAGTRLRARLAEAEATLEAIRTGGIDAVVVSGPGGERTLALEGATHPYNVLLDAMGDGAALLAPDGTILFGNRRLREMARTRRDLRGRRFQELVTPAAHPAFNAFLRSGLRRTGAAEYAMVDGDAPGTPVWISLTRVLRGAYPGVTGTRARSGAVLMAIVTDLTERKRAEATRLTLTQRLFSAEDEERRRIARELHDETGQSLTALLVGLRAIEGMAVTRDVQSAARRLRRVASQTVGDVGRLARGLHPSILDDMGFMAAARRYARDYAASFGIAVHVRVARSVPQPLPRLVQTTLYRVLQEALTNVSRHAGARAAVVGLKRQGALLELLIRDDGGGFDVEAALRRASGLGLHGMRERIALLGGSVAITSVPGRGTVVRALVPVDDTAHPAIAPGAARRRHAR